ELVLVNRRYSDASKPPVLGRHISLGPVYYSRGHDEPIAELRYTAAFTRPAGCGATGFPWERWCVHKGFVTGSAER
ncbi:MAG: hypothetical protein FWD57_16930, partial [Polyangiaceae bacterium]|nr:hypothetical protein [Polyangiaceae bacterium]